MSRRGLGRVEMVIIALIIGILAGIFLPPLSSKHGPSRRAICFNQLRQISKALHLYAEEQGGLLPPIDSTKNNFIFSGQALYPEYVNEIELFACPADLEYSREENFRLISMDRHPNASVGDPHPDCITDMSYGYVGWIIMNDEEAESFFEAYDSMPSEDYDRDILVPEGKGNAGGDTIHRLSMDVDSFLLPEANTSLIGDETVASVVPVMWDQISTDIMEFSHVPAGQNVLYLDGNIDFYRFDGLTTTFPASSLSAEIFGGRKREPIPDCEE